MNAQVLQTSGLAAIFPEGKIVTIPRPNGQNEELRVLPMPVKKWKQGFDYIAKIAPLLGFNLAQSVENTDLQATSIEEEIVKSMPTEADLKGTVFNLLHGEHSEVIFDFLAFAIDKDVDWLGELYDEIIDIALAVIEVNLVFFIQRVLPKFLAATLQVKDIATTVRQHVQGVANP